jgi:hypothetical protein
MIRKLMRAAMVVGFLAVVGGLGGADVLRADEDEDEQGD